MKRQMIPVRRLLLISLTVLTTLGLPAGAQYAGGTGTADDPYQIETAEQMNAVGLHPEDWDKHFRLTANIDMNDLGRAQVNLIEEFRGVFDGGGHTIANLTYPVQDEDAFPDSHFIVFVGLFRVVYGWDALIKDLGLIHPQLQPAPTCTMEIERMGALVGVLVEGWVRNCYVEGGRVVGARRIGGLVGSCQRYAAVSDSWSSAEVSGLTSVGGLVGSCEQLEIWHCHALARVSGGLSVGGLIGSCSSESMVDDCFTTGVVAAGQRVGGLIGFLSGVVSNCYSTAQVSANLVEAGGFVGKNNGIISACRAGGNVTGERMVGGLVGLNAVGEGLYPPGYDHTTITDSYATGAVQGNSLVGGLIGQNEGMVLRCYSVGAVTGSTAASHLGGLVAFDYFAQPDWNVRDCLWDTTTSGLFISDGGAGLATAQMQDMGTYLAAGWDFAGTWKMSDGEPGYPRLAWEQPPADGPADPNGGD